MKNMFRIITLILVFALTACKHQAKEEEVNLQNLSDTETVNSDKITKNVFTDTYGDKLEVTLNETKNTVIVHLNGKTYEMKKSDELPEYTATNPDYQYSDIRGEVTLLRKGYNMVLFHHKKDKPSSNTKMASY
ncbi:hypothetical protein EG349_16885 [Chryseobacterium shandongense]|jgi:hypothetical protein|uniref:Uncharacterized protein n=1 Tax=Chryseobacterium shandongense TaxID=1493872 RepID=A0AAD1DN18_9FLAO|nr:hypothetical protein [Chryseobacterium shandongense]AZA88326.1 hypothetical protein EG349_16885 [Chryseobacterium shandongense]AZA96887.1 hypothetical protein EG353_15675 [Chryseobacterium shandongense]